MLSTLQIGIEISVQFYIMKTALCSITQVDESFVPIGCTEHCTCTEGGEVECEPLTCHADAVCEARNETRDCYCREGFEGDGILCLGELTNLFIYMNLL